MIIVKVGGGSSINLQGVLKDLSQIDEQFIIIHGANALRDELANSLNMEKKILTSIKGHSSVYSDDGMIDLIYMSYAGLANKRIVEMAQQLGINAIGLSGIDGGLISGLRNSGIRVFENGKKKVIRDRSGKAKNINTGLLQLLLDNGYCPVISIPILDENNVAINSENDDIVALFQETLKSDKIIFLIEASGLMEDVSDPTSLLKKIKKSELEILESKESGRIKRKYYALKKMTEAGPVKIIISDGRTEHPIFDALAEKGTVIE